MSSVRTSQLARTSRARAAIALAGAACGLAAIPPAAVAAVPCPAVPEVGATVAAVDGEARLAWIAGHLSRTAHRATVWKWGWGVGIGAATVANLAPLPFVKPENRIDWYTSAASTAIGIVPLLIAPLDVIEDASALGARRTALGANDDVCGELAFAESLLVRDARNQADGQRWWIHVGNVVVNAGVGLFLGLGFHHWLAGGFNFVSGTAIGEAIILTQPTGSIDDLRRYRTGVLDERPVSVGLRTGGSF